MQTYYKLKKAYLLMSMTDTRLLWSHAGGAHNAKASMVTAMSAVILSEGSLCRSRDTTLLTPVGALPKAKHTASVNKQLLLLRYPVNSQHT